MKVSLQWLKQYIDLDHSIEKLRDILTFSGIEVEAVQTLSQLPDTIISARVKSAERIEGSDHLRVCMVDTGSEILQVVCGADNCSAGMIAILALPGTALGDFRIKPTKIRGVESNGMLCSEKELGLSENHAGIIAMSADTPLGVSANELFGLPDVVFELEITPNRSDLLGYLGIARDLSASTGLACKVPMADYLESEEAIESGLSIRIADPDLCPRYTARLFRGVRIADSPLWLQNRLIRAGLRPINNVVDITNFVMLETGHPLHAFDYHSLSGNGATKQIIIRRAVDGERINALDGRDYSLSNDDLVIADSVKPIAIAGVIGGANSHITTDTVDIVLESAAFNPQSVRRTSYKYKINTDSSYRFERHLSAQAASYASDRATQLIIELCGAKVCQGRLDEMPNPAPERVLGLRPSRFKRIIGYELEGTRIIQYLEKLGLGFIQYGDWKPGNITNIEDIYCFHGEQVKQGLTEFDPKDDCVHSLYFRIPPYRIDLEREIDLIEELARLDGYDKVPQKTAISLIMDRHAFSIKRKLQDTMVSAGVYEVVNYSFDDPGHLEYLGYDVNSPQMQMMNLKNPQNANQSVMRTTLIPQLLHTLQYNLNHSEKNARVFELNKTYIKGRGDSYSEPYRLSALLTGCAGEEHWQQKDRLLDFYDVKGIAENLLESVGIASYSTRNCELPFVIASLSVCYMVNDVPLLWIGKLKPEIADRFGIDVVDLKQDIWLIDMDVDAVIQQTRALETIYQALPKYPSVQRDMSFLISDRVSYSELRDRILKIDQDIIKGVQIFDEYRGKQVPEGYRSLSLHLIFNDSEKTLTVQRVEQLFDSVQKMLLEEWHIKMR